ncbi:tRNA pseudouridine(55) synthase TruB [Salicola sp. Rm-C-2C1-2]|uniref:tRNA pseudouridine(55) synthase TruB n=1 Tax=Salicola sp. Rm-C-2C1-2 TaxID=3141321 RepID=UPI0032E43A79
MSRRRRGDDINGVLVLDKPAEMTSKAALQQVRRLLNAARAGHTGALDPLATGILPLCFGEATKFAQRLLEADKTYCTVAKLGQRTTTSDADGEAVQTRAIPSTLDPAALEAALEGFRGAIEQVPSMYSALKYQGRPLYEYAREGQTVPREARSIRVDELTVLRLEGDELELRVRCSKGTYIRTLVDDIGEALGCGAHVAELRREQAGAFELTQALDLDELETMGRMAAHEHLLPPDVLLSDLPATVLEGERAVSISHGQAVTISGSEPGGEGFCRLYDQDQRFLGLAEKAGDAIKPRRLMSARG